MPCFFSNSACLASSLTVHAASRSEQHYGAVLDHPDEVREIICLISYTGFLAKQKADDSHIHQFPCWTHMLQFTHTQTRDRPRSGIWGHFYIQYIYNNIYIYNPEFKILTSSKTQNDKIHQKQINLKTVIFLFLARTFLGEFYKFSIYSLNYCT